MKSRDIIIRESAGKDLPSLAQLRWQLCTDDAAAVNQEQQSIFIEQFYAQMKTQQAAGNIHHYLAEIGGNIVGVITLILVAKVPSPDMINSSWGYLTNVYVKPEYRNKGIGTELLKYVEYISRQNDIELLIVWPSDRSYPFYKRQGFRSERREQDHWCW